MTLEELEQAKSDGMIDDRKYQQLKAKLSMQGYQPGQQYTAYNMANYGKNLQAQESEPEYNTSFGYDEREAKIAQLEEQIAQVKERIARNERTLTNKSFEDVNNKLANLEMSKIGLRLNKPSVNQDPTSFWRWNMQRLDTLKSNAALKNDAANKFANTVDMWVNTRPANSTEGIIQQISNINSAIRDGKNAGADVSRLIEKKNEFEKLVYGDDRGIDTTSSSSKYATGTSTEKRDADVKDVLSAAKTSPEIARYLKENRAVLTPEQINQLSAKQRELVKKENEAKARELFEDWLKNKRGYKNGSYGIPPKNLKTLERQYKEGK